MRSEPATKTLSIAWQDMCGPVPGYIKVLPTKNQRGPYWCRHHHRPQVGFILRCCVASPQPQEIIEIDSIRTLLARKLHHDYCHRRGKGAINFGQPAEQWLDNLTPAPWVQAIGGRTGTCIVTCQRINLMTDTTLLAVNGTLMRGLKLNPNLTNAGGVFVREDKTDGHYRLWSINDDHPAMIRTIEPGSQVELEIWELPLAANTFPNTAFGFHTG